MDGPSHHRPTPDHTTSDRGQLGLGHRINMSRFSYVSALEGVVVVQIACGQAHNCARTLGMRPSHPFDTADVKQVASSSGVFVWGNGSLGQLGLGRRVTGRRVPVLLPALSHADVTIIDVAAGNNHRCGPSESLPPPSPSPTHSPPPQCCCGGHGRGVDVGPWGVRPARSRVSEQERPGRRLVS